MELEKVSMGLKRPEIGLIRVRTDGWAPNEGERASDGTGKSTDVTGML